ARTRTVHTPDGRELWVEVAGASSDRTILVHGGTPNSRHLYPAWIDDAESRGAQLVSYERPGYGGSTPSQTTPWLTQPTTSGRSPRTWVLIASPSGDSRAAAPTRWRARPCSRNWYR